MKIRLPLVPAAALLAMVAVAAAVPSGTGASRPEDPPAPCSIAVRLPASERPFPEPLGPDHPRPGFALRGTKGWGWTPEQYLAEIPWLVKGKMNFLMNCYLSMFPDPGKLENDWRAPIPEAKKAAYAEVVKACRAAGIDFCFAYHPQLFDKAPFRFDSEDDFALLWSRYAWMQGLGVRWFSLSYDDISMEGVDKAELGRLHGRLANRLLAKLREKDPGARLIFCPVYYMGCGDSADAKPYLASLGETLDPKALVFWTGDAVVPVRLTVACAKIFRGIVKHEMVIWDNYPVNDRNPALHLGPVSGREPGLTDLAYGYMSNPHGHENDINRIPLLTCADFAYNPWAYDPARSIGQAILRVGGPPAEREALAALVELYPGDINCGTSSTGYNSVMARFDALLAGPEGRAGARAFLARVRAVADRMDATFPGAYVDTRELVRRNVAAMERKLGNI